MDFAKGDPKIPAVLHRSNHAVGHNEEAKEEVSNGHGEDEKVGWGMQLFKIGD